MPQRGKGNAERSCEGDFERRAEVRNENEQRGEVLELLQLKGKEKRAIKGKENERHAPECSPWGRCPGEREPARRGRRTRLRERRTREGEGERGKGKASLSGRGRRTRERRKSNEGRGRRKRGKPPRKANRGKRALCVRTSCSWLRLQGERGQGDHVRTMCEGF